MFEEFAIVDWHPLWLDNGKRLRELLDLMADVKDESAWIIFSCILADHLSQDLTLHAEGMKIIADVRNER